MAPRFLSPLKDWLSYSKPTEENTLLPSEVFFPTWELLTGKYRTHEKSKYKAQKQLFPQLRYFALLGIFSSKNKKKLGDASLQHNPRRQISLFPFAHGNNMYNLCGLGPILVQQHRQEKAGTLHSYSFHKGSQNIFN